MRSFAAAAPVRLHRRLPHRDVRTAEGQRRATAGLEPKACRCSRCASGGRPKTEHREEFSYGGLLVGNVDNDSGGQAKIVTGSLNGTLRIYLPTHNEFKIEHLLLGRKPRASDPPARAWLLYSRILALAVLHPRRLGVYVVEGVGGSGMSANYFRITQRYEHRLGIDGEHFTAFNMIHGPFGTTGPLNNSFVPGPICLREWHGRDHRRDVGSAARVLSYQVLASASLKKKAKTALDSDDAAPKQVHCDWKLNLGETLVDIRIGRCFDQESATSFDILVLATTSNSASAGTMDNVLVASHSKLWAVFKDKSLLWSAWASTVPVGLHVVDVGGIDGMIRLLPWAPIRPSTAVVAPDTKEINYEEMDEEHRQLLNHKYQRFSTRSLNVATSFNSDGKLAAQQVSNVTLSIRAPENVLVNEESIVIGTIDGRSSTPLIVPVVLRPSPTAMPTSLDVVIAAAYTLETGQPHMFHQPFCSPDWAKQIVGGSGTNVLSFQYYNGVEATILVSKNAGRYRIQSNELEALWLVSSELVERLKQFFAPHQQAESKQRDDLTASGVEIFYQEPLPLADFFGTIDQHFALRKEKLEISAELNDRAHQFRVIQKRLLVRYKDRNPSSINCLDALLHGTYEQLLALSHRMEDVDTKLLSASNRLSCCVRLILMLIQFRFHLDDENARLLACYLSPEIHEYAASGAGAATAVDGQGWEERTDAAMTELLRTLLAKQPAPNGNKEAAAAVVQDLSLPEDTKKLKKHITIVCDRLGKGVTLVPTPSSSAAAAEQRAEK
ncbi:hypothetical protein PINS_up022466 [Pythium insidiosum]|nr:hypothetical protein PINS_up022466 [Pythium insidiosum]